MMNSETSCTYSDSDVPSRYVAGSIGGADAEAFEEHYFGCDRCWTEVRAGTGIRQISGAKDRRRVTTVSWIGLAAAAALVLATLGIVRNRLDERPDVLRGGGTASMVITAQRDRESVQLSWQRIESATRYEIVINSADGEVVQRASTPQNSFATKVAPEADLFVTVTAFDADDGELARSSPQRIAAR